MALLPLASFRFYKLYMIHEWTLALPGGERREQAGGPAFEINKRRRRFIQKLYSVTNGKDIKKK